MSLTLTLARKIIVAYGVPAMIAVALHGAVAAGVWSLGNGELQAPKILNSFEVVELASSAAVVVPRPPEPEPAPQAEPKPEQVATAEPEDLPKTQLMQKAVQKPTPKPKPIARPLPPVAKAQPQPPQPAFVQSAEAEAPAPAFVAPRQHAAYLNNPKPAYPTMARKRGMEGRVVLRVNVDADGKVTSADVEQSTGYSLLDRAARTAVLRWRFAPATLGLTPVAGVVLVPFDFRLTAEH